MPGVLTRFRQDPPRAGGSAHKTQVNPPWTNGKIEAVWATLKSEVLDRQVFRSIADAEAALAVFACYYNYPARRDWLADPAERSDGTPFTDRGFDHVTALAHLVPWLDDLRKAA